MCNEYPSILAIVVTYNRRELLAECLCALERIRTGESRFGVLIIDNASMDDTQEFVTAICQRHEAWEYYRLNENIGGAGGFYEGIRRGVAGGFDYLWLMDDDTMVKEDSLEKLLDAAKKVNNDFGYLASRVLWVDGQLSLMNKVTILDTWDQFSKNLEQGLIPILRATFVSLFIKADIIKEIGLPIKEFFIWSDDQEYTERIAAKYMNYYVPGSEVIHKMVRNVGADIVTDDPERISRYFYAFRNEYYIASKKGLREKMKYYWRILNTIRKVIFFAKGKKLYRLRIVFKGVFGGLRFKPQIEKNIINFGG